MSQAYSLTPEAEANLSEILEFVDLHFGPLVTDRVTADFRSAFRLVASTPYIGRVRPDLWPEPYRFWRC